MVQVQPFDRDKHVYKNEAFVELVKDAMRFFNGTPVYPLNGLQSFTGTGVYALYYIGQTGLYSPYGDLNRLAYNAPIYVGKAVPKGWRQARVAHDPSAISTHELCSRLKEHARSITAVHASGLSLTDFMCRFMIFEAESSDMIGSVEAALIKWYRPLWNVTLDGFGNHDPGKGRYEQARSDWDVIHPGRVWAARCAGVAHSEQSLRLKIEHHFLTQTLSTS